MYDLAYLRPTRIVNGTILGRLNTSFLSYCHELLENTENKLARQCMEEFNLRNTNWFVQVHLVTGLVIKSLKSS